MLFNSVPFLLFFPLVAALHWWLPHRFRWLLLLVASYAFYMYWEPLYAVLILTSTVVDWFVALRIPAAEGRARKAWMGCSLLVNLGLLGAFKYYTMLVTTVSALLAGVGVVWTPAETTLLLPVGISFYTFQTLSYTVDVYRGTLQPERHLGRFALFVSFFPQLVAGPIERAGRLLPQLIAVRAWDTERAIGGLRLALWGMFKKVVVADHLAVFVDAVYDQPQLYGGPVIALATFVFTYQVYCDFSGYSDMAIGMARILGVELSMNFDQPTLARNVADFWTRWHMTLIGWFRDYVYFPLGGSRGSARRTAFNVLAVFALSGLWHGAAWHFVVWGAINGAYIIVGRVTAGARSAVAQAVGLTRVPRVQAVWQWASTVTIVYGSFIFFRAPDIPHALGMYARLPLGWAGLLDGGFFWRLASLVRIEPAILAMALLLVPLTDAAEWVRRHPERFQNLPHWTTWLTDYALVFGILVLGRFAAQEFVYFQF